MEKFPSAEGIVAEAKTLSPKDINELHEKTYGIMLKHRKTYYAEKARAFLETTSLPAPARKQLLAKMLEPVEADGKKYSNFMEEASRRISQTFQVISGNIAELCVAHELNGAGLIEGTHYLRKKDRTDFLFYHPNLKAPIATHRLEVKNIKLRERGVRGLAFDGDSLLGFFDDAKEFTRENAEIIDEHCAKTGGYCYLPPETLEKITVSTKRFRSNLKVASGMKQFVEKGFIR